MIQQRPARRPWTFAAVCVMVTSLTLLVFGLTQVPVIELLPGYVTAYLLIGVCIFGPHGKLPSLRQASAFLLPGALLVVLALLNLGFWCGGWLLGLPAWGLLLSRSTTANPIRAAVVLKFFGLLVLGLAVFTFNIMWVIFSLGLFLLPIVPLLRLPHPEYWTRPLQTAAGGTSGRGCRGDCRCYSHPRRVMVLALGVCGRGRDGWTHDHILGLEPPPPLPAPAAQ